MLRTIQRVKEVTLGEVIKAASNITSRQINRVLNTSIQDIEDICSGKFTNIKNTLGTFKNKVVTKRLKNQILAISKFNSQSISNRDRGDIVNLVLFEEYILPNKHFVNYVEIDIVNYGTLLQILKKEYKDNILVTKRIHKGVEYKYFDQEEIRNLINLFSVHNVTIKVEVDN